MDEALLAELRHRAVDAHMSLSAWITMTLESLVPHAGEVEAARSRCFDEQPKRGLSPPGRRPPELLIAP